MWGAPRDTVSLDPAADTTGPGSIVYGNITETLITLEADGSYKPCLATGYKIMAPDRIRFFLRKASSSTMELLSTPRRLNSPLTGAVKLPARWLSLFGPFKKAKVVDDHTVDIITKVPYGPLLSSMTMVYTGIISPTAAQKYGQGLRPQRSGNRPFKFQTWKAKDKIVLLRNDSYWGEKAKLKKVTFRVIPEAGAR